jgi:hypothetical protein
MFNPAEALRDNPALFACYILNVYFRGQNAVRIEREMRALGYTTFHRRSLYPRGKHPGWIAKHNWSDAVSVPPSTGAVGVSPTNSDMRAGRPRLQSRLPLLAQARRSQHDMALEAPAGDHRSAREIYGGHTTAADDLPPAASRKDGPYPCMRCSFKSIYQRVASYNLRIANCEGLPLILWRPVKTGQAAHPKTP